METESRHQLLLCTSEMFPLPPKKDSYDSVQGFSFTIPFLSNTGASRPSTRNEDYDTQGPSGNNKPQLPQNGTNSAQCLIFTPTDSQTPNANGHVSSLVNHQKTIPFGILAQADTKSNRATPLPLKRSSTNGAPIVAHTNPKNPVLLTPTKDYSTIKAVGALESIESVRCIPCFHEGCTYSYKRPGSSITEISDRALVLPSKFNGFVIRACKKHHDHWRGAFEKITAEKYCEICRNLNSGLISNYVNEYETVYDLCDICAHKQEKMIHLILGTAFPTVENSEKIVLYKASSPCQGWAHHVKGVKFTTENICMDPAPKDLPEALQVDVHEGAPYSLKIEPVTLKFDVPFFVDSLGLFSNASIPVNVCLGEFTGKVTKMKAAPIIYDKYRIQISNSYEIDASVHGNEFRFLNHCGSRSANVYIQQYGSRLFIFSLNDIQQGEELLIDRTILPFAVPIVSCANGNSNNGNKISPTTSSGSKGSNASSPNASPNPTSGGSPKKDDNLESEEPSPNPKALEESFSNSYQKYLDILREIDKFGMEHLTKDELGHAAIHWFVKDGYRQLQDKSKVTVPIEYRIPAKRGLASVLSQAKQNSEKQKGRFSMLKNQMDWGYVAQLESLDLERAREDCWVTFKPGKFWDFSAFEQAVTVWTSESSGWKIFEEVGEALASPHPKRRSSVASSSSRDHDREERIHHKREKIQPQKVEEDSSDMKMETTMSQQQQDKEEQVEVEELNLKKVKKTIESPFLKLQVLRFSELKVAFDGSLIKKGKNGFLFKGFWREFPVVLRFPSLKFPVAEDERRTFIGDFNSKVLMHPNLVSCYGLCIDQQLCAVMEHCNIGDLEKWISETKYPIRVAYAPRICLDIIRVLDFLHSNDMTYENLRASRILLKGEHIGNENHIAALEVKLSLSGCMPKQSTSKSSLEYYTGEPKIGQKTLLAFAKIMCQLLAEHPQSSDEQVNPLEFAQNSGWLRGLETSPKWIELLDICTNPKKNGNFSSAMQQLLKLNKYC